MRSSSASSPCRIELAPSRLQAAALAALAVLAPFALIASGLPRALAWPLAAVALGWGAWALRREVRRPVRVLEVSGTGARLDGQPLERLSVTWRGPLAALRWRAADGSRGQHLLWPDCLPPAARRELRLATGPSGRTVGGRGVAP